MAERQAYQQAAGAYAVQLRGLFAPPPGAPGPTRATRSGMTVPPDLLAERAEAVAETSLQVGQMTAGYLAADEATLREAAEVKLLAQAAAGFDLAAALLDEADAAEREVTPARPSRTRASRAAGLQRSLDELADVLEMPLEAGLAPLLRVSRRRSGRRQADPARARARLGDEVDKALRRIGERASAVGARAARDLLLMDGAALVQGLSLVSRDAAELLDRAIAGLGRLAKRLASAAVRLLLQAYDWVLALLGKDTAQRARSQVKAWLDELKGQQGGGKDGGPVATLVERIYGSAAIRAEVAGWLEATGTDADVLERASGTVAELAEKYRVKVERVERFLRAVALAKKVPVVNSPQGQVVAAAVTLGLLGYVLYAGYDHVDSGSAVFAGRFGFGIPDRVEGVRETVQKALVNA